METASRPNGWRPDPISIILVVWNSSFRLPSSGKILYHLMYFCSPTLGILGRLWWSYCRMETASRPNGWRPDPISIILVVWNSSFRLPSSGKILYHLMYFCSPTLGKISILGSWERLPAMPKGWKPEFTKINILVVCNSSSVLHPVGRSSFWWPS